MPLHVLIVGAGIAGLACAIALGREGHEVDIFEKSGFANEIGAAYHSGPYAVKIYRQWGVNIEAMRALQVESWEDRDCYDVSKILDSKFVLKQKQKELGIDESLDEIMHHRIDAHRTLREHALAMPNVRLHLSSGAQAVDPKAGTITLINGDMHTGDLVIGADGVHSKLVGAIDPEAAVTAKTGINMYRFMVRSKLALEDPDVAPLLKAIDYPRRHVRFVHQPTYHSLVMYSCRDGELINCATFQSAAQEIVPLPEGDYNSQATLDEVLHVIKEWPASYKALARLGEDRKHWAVINRDVPHSSVSGRLALVGDAAHPTQPTYAAGANMGVEDAAVLGVLFGKDLKTPITAKDVPARLRLFNELRFERTTIVKYASEMQNLAWQDFRDKTAARIKAKCGGRGELPKDMISYLWTFDAVEDARAALARLDAET